MSHAFSIQERRKGEEERAERKRGAIATLTS